MNPSIAALGAAPFAPKKVLVLGVGNTLLADEGVGIHALAHMQRSYGDLPDVELLDGGTLSFVLAGAVETALKGHTLHDPTQAIEILRTIHSFDPCTACAVHVSDPSGAELVQVKVR